MIAEIAAWVGGAATLAMSVVAVWLALRLVRAGGRVDEAVAARLTAEAEAEKAKEAQLAAEVERDAAFAARDAHQKSLAECRRAQGVLYAKLREVGAPGAGDLLDDDIRRLYPDADDHEAGPGTDRG